MYSLVKASHAEVEISFARQLVFKVEEVICDGKSSDSRGDKGDPGMSLDAKASEMLRDPWVESSSGDAGAGTRGETGCEVGQHEEMVLIAILCRDGETMNDG